MALFDKFWHKTLRRPYPLAKPVDEGSGPPVILLHGIGRTGQVWEYVVDGLRVLGLRVVAFDLLGFGDSPKPDWPDYNVDDHAKAVISSIEKLKLDQPAVIVGHSMGSLVAVRVARRRPDLVKHLVLYEMPLYEGLPQKKVYRLRIALYLKLYRRILKIETDANPAEAKRLDKLLASRIAGLEASGTSQIPFLKSLEHTIINQNTAADIKDVEMPMDVVYGTFDMLVIRGKAQQFFGTAKDNINVHSVRAGHTISKRASMFLVKRVMAALNVVG